MLQGQPLHPLKHALHIFTDAPKEGWGAHFNEHTARGTWSLPESKLHKLPGTKDSLFGTKRVSRPLRDQHSSCSHRKHHSGCLHKQRRGGDEEGPSFCPPVGKPDLVCQKAGYPQSPTHSRPADCGNRQAIQARPDHSNRVVTPPRGLPSDVQKVASASDLFAIWFNNKLAHFIALIHLTYWTNAGLTKR